MSGYPAGQMGIDPRTKSAVLWGLVGALSFLVLVQGYALLVAPLVSITGALALAAAVGIGAGLGAYLLEPRIAAWALDRGRGDGSRKG
ncbi:hypothetical protein A6E15_02645 [Natrinema saccharevitans]|uniref:DUF7981 domain-containing protein n=1 Tax=Natrinema saccharevitans TaxID=301967 RepID=A0A1S8ATA5_9EURY|nr:hypothetical protein [Natrinema saccharevitans]OLZ39945.1 hypothetical protein A6E15_02645 [Natrinema saccharevitans]